MLFHITATHDPTNCSAHKPERQAAYGKLAASAESFGIKPHGIYADAPGHALYMTIECDNAMALSNWLDPVLEYAHHDVRPVVDANQLLASLRE